MAVEFLASASMNRTIVVTVLDPKETERPKNLALVWLYNPIERSIRGGE